MKTTSYITLALEYDTLLKSTELYIVLDLCPRIVVSQDMYKILSKIKDQTMIDQILSKCVAVSYQNGYIQRKEVQHKGRRLPDANPFKE